MKYGMNLLLWTAGLDAKLMPILTRLKAMGYDGVEVPIFDPALNAQTWAKTLDDLGLERTVVTCCAKDTNLASPDAAVRAAGMEYLKRVIDCTHTLGATLLCGPYHSALGEFTGKGPTEDELKWSADGIRTVAEHAAGANVMLTPEALNRFECYLVTCMEQLVDFVRRVKHPNCRGMYDTFHAHIEEKRVSAAIQTVAPVLRHVHISENDRSTPGTGTVRWDYSFGALADAGYDGWLVVEAFGLALPELVAATKIWRRMYDTEEQLAHDALAFMKEKVARHMSAAST